MRNALSIDLEDWFNVYNFEGVLHRSEWDELPLRVEQSTGRLLDLFADREVRATFFVLGWIAERAPDLIRRIDAEGHEIASHGYSHRLVTHMDRPTFEADLDRSLEVLRDLTDQPIRGFRAPSFSITRDTLWALDVLVDRGFLYDSSIFPVGFHPDYGIADAPLGIHRRPGGLFEIPMSVAHVRGRRVPCSGGGYFRLLPLQATAALMRQCHAEGRPVVFYAHPWEFDPDQPRMPLSPVKRFRHYNNLHRTFGRLERLLDRFDFGPVVDLVPQV